MVEPAQNPRVLSGRYELSHLVARGGMAEVYRARDRLLDRPVALKILFPELSVDRSFVERFRREAQAAANLSHPSIVPVFDWGEDAGTYFIVMEFVDGRALSSILRGAGPLHPDRAAEVAADVAGALAYAHRHGVVHRDVKPGNVLITEEGVVKVTDFGIARALNTEESLTQTGAVMGTATYFSPEQAEGMGVDARSDIYSLGVVLFEMVTGRPPFLGDTPVAVASKHVRDNPPMPRDVNPAIPPDLEAVILKCMAKSPDHRYATGDDLRFDLLRFREGRSVVATIPPTPPAATQAIAAAQPMGATQAMGAIQPMGTAGVTTAVPQVDGQSPQEPEQPKSRTGIYATVLVLLLVALAVVVLLLGQSLGWWHLGTGSGVSTFKLPDVTGKNLTQAESTLQGDGLKVRIQKDSASSAPNTQVVATVPRKGSTVHKGETVTLVTGGAATSTQRTVPTNLVGESLTSAESELQQLGLSPQIQYISTCTQQNIVCDTLPKGGKSLQQGGTVILYTAQTSTTATTSPDVTIPDVSGDTPTVACSILGNDGLVCSGQQTTQFSQTIAQGDVIGTQPAVGTSVLRQTSITLVVSGGSPPLVPGVTGDSYGQAKDQLQSRGLTGASDGTCVSNSDVVTGEDPPAGSAAPPDGQVVLSCSTSTTTTTTAT
jgi:serine/threonine-protein kinase